MEGNIYKVKEYAYTGMYDSKKYYIIIDVNYFIDSYTMIEVDLNSDETRKVDVTNSTLKQLFDLEFDAFLNNWKFNANTLNYTGTYSNDVLSWKRMINYKGKCYHIWKKYVGFIEQYEFCEKCNEKRFNNG